MPEGLPTLPVPGILETNGRQRRIVHAAQGPFRAQLGQDFIDVTVAGVTVILPANAPLGTEFEVYDGFGTASGTPIVVTDGGGALINGAGSYSISVDRAGVKLLRNTLGWFALGLGPSPAGLTLPSGTGFLTVTGGVLDNPLAPTITTTQDINASDIGASGFLIAGTAVEVGAAPAASGAVRLSLNGQISSDNGGGLVRNLIQLSSIAGAVLIADSAHEARIQGLTASCHADSFTAVKPGVIIYFYADAANGQTLGYLSSSGSWGGGVGVVSILNANTVPVSNPTGGSVLYTEAGATKIRSSGGTVTTIAPA